MFPLVLKERGDIAYLILAFILQYYCTASSRITVVDPSVLFGTVHVPIPTRVDSCGIVCHVYLRCILSDVVQIQGFLKLESVSEVRWTGGPHIRDANVKNITLKLLDERRELICVFNVKESELHSEMIPKVLYAEVSIVDFERTVWLGVEGGDRLHFLGDFLKCVPRTASTDKKKLVLSLPPPFSVEASIFSRLLEFHAGYHIDIGFDHETVYIRTSRSFQPTLNIDKLVQSSKLYFVRWTSADSGVAFPDADTLNERAVFYYDQTIILNHVILSYWGRNAYLALLDLDEFVFIPSQLNLQQLYEQEGCLSPFQHQAKLKRFVSICHSCEQGPDWKKLLSTRTSNHFPFNLYKDTWRNIEHASDTWNAEPDTWDVKSVVDPDAIRHYHVHWGSVVSSFMPTADATPKQGVVNESCAIVVHLLNFIVNRRNSSIAHRFDLESLHNMRGKHENFLKIQVKEHSLESSRVYKKKVTRELTA